MNGKLLGHSHFECLEDFASDCAVVHWTPEFLGYETVQNLTGKLNQMSFEVCKEKSVFFSKNVDVIKMCVESTKSYDRKHLS